MEANEIVFFLSVFCVENLDVHCRSTASVDTEVFTS